MMQQQPLPTVKEIQEKLQTDLAWLERAVLAVYRKQTLAEQKHATTVEQNGWGFNSSDARFMSSIARQLMKGSHLFERQIPIVRKKMTKYGSQLLRIAQEKRGGTR
jgi:hypothetical protein